MAHSIAKEKRKTSPRRKLSREEEGRRRNSRDCRGEVVKLMAAT
jgi:hypothetical protein